MTVEEAERFLEMARVLTPLFVEAAAVLAENKDPEGGYAYAEGRGEFFVSDVEDTLKALAAQFRGVRA